jgi:hypothetical protein
MSDHDIRDSLRIAKALQAMDEADWTSAQWTFALVWELEAEVNNGGFHQYFFNSSGRHAPEIASLLDAIGASHCAELVRQATRLAGKDFPWSDIAGRRQALRTAPPDLETALDALDTAFYAYPDDLEALLAAHVIRHRADFETL